MWASGRCGEEEEYETAADHGVARGWYADAVCVRVLNADPLRRDQELTMAMLDDAPGCAASDARKPDRTVQTRRRLWGLSVGRGLALVLLCAGAMLVTSGAADARSRGKARSAPPPRPCSMRSPSMQPRCRRRRARDALPLPAWPRPSSPRCCSIAPASRRVRSTARTGPMTKRRSPRFSRPTGSSRVGRSTPRPGSAWLRHPPTRRSSSTRFSRPT